MTTFCFGLIFNFLSAIFQFLSRRFFSGLCFSTIRLFPTGTQVVADLQTNLNEDFGPQFQQVKVKRSLLVDLNKNQKSPKCPKNAALPKLYF